MNVDRDIVYLSENDCVDVPPSQRKLITNNPYFKPKPEKELDTQEMSSKLYWNKLLKETEEQKVKRLAQNKISAAKCRQKKMNEYQNVKYQANEI